MKSLREQIEEALNSCSAENMSNTPDFILAQYLINCLDCFDTAVKNRDEWYGVHLEPVNKYFKE